MKRFFSFIFVLLVLVLNSCAQEKKKTIEEEEIEFEDHIHSMLNLSEEEIEENYLDTISKVTKFSNALLFEDTLKALYEEIDVDSIKLDFKVFRLAMIGYYSLRQEGKLDNTRELITIIDYTLPSTAKRFYTIDLENKQFVFNTLVSHGRNTGANKATKFSNTPQSFQTSLGFYVTGKTYIGGKGFSLRLHGHDTGFNDKAFSRAIVMHDAPYVSEEWVKKYGRIGRSLGCPVLPKKISKNVINTIKNKTAIFAYYNDTKYLKASKFLNLNALIEKMNLKPEE